MMNARSALGRGLGSLIPQKQTITEQLIPTARKEILEIETASIRENPHQPRQHFAQNDLDDLMQSIKEHGMIVPIIVTRSGGGYELIAGERRLRASRALGLATVPAIVREASEQQKLELAIIENTQRQDLNAIEEALGYRALIDEFNLTQEVVAQKVGKNRSTITNMLRLLELPGYILDALKDGRISKSHARTLLAEPDPKKQQMFFDQMLNGGMTVRAIEAMVTGIGRKTAMPFNKDPNILAHEKRLREVLGTKVEIQEAEGRGKIIITFYSRSELLDLLERLSA